MKSAREYAKNFTPGMMRLLKVDKSDTTAREYIECAMSCHLPICCMLFYLKIWRFVDGADESDHLARQLRDYIGLSGYGYVICPTCCIVRRRVKLRPAEARRLKRARVNAARASAQMPGTPSKPLDWSWKDVEDVLELLPWRQPTSKLRPLVRS